MDKTILVKHFTAPWCGPCRVVKPTMESLEAQYPQVTFETVDIDEARGEADAHGVRSIPTVIFIVDGVEKGRVTGAVHSNNYSNLLESLTHE